MSLEPHRELEIDRVLGDAVRAVMHRFGPYTLLILILVAPLLAWVQWQQPSFGTAPDLEDFGRSTVGGLIAWVMLKLAHAFVMIDVLDRLRRKSSSLGEVQRRALGRWPSLVITAFIFLLIESGGFILFCVPGLVLFTLFYPVQPIVTAESGSPFRAFSRAMDLTEGNRWRVLGIGLVVFLIDVVLGLPQVATPILMPDNPLPTAVLGIVKAIVMEPFRAGVMVSTYYHLRRVREDFDSDDVVEVFA